MKKSIYAMMAAASLVVSSTAAVAATSTVPAPVVTPLTQPANENVAGNNQFLGFTAIGTFLFIGTLAAFAAVIVFAVKSGDKGNNPPRTSP